MGDGKINRYALIINGDAEDRHLENVERSLKTLEAQDYETFVASTSEPKENHDHYSEASLAKDGGIERLVRGITQKIDEDDDLVIYTTGHGDSDKEKGELCIEGDCDHDKFASLLDIKRYGQRTVIMDQCFGGNWSGLFLDNPKTLFISAGSQDEATCCNKFTPHFWGEDAVDLNGDGIINWQERYAVAKKEESGTFAQFVASAGYVQTGIPYFAPEVKEINNERDMSKELDGLKPGQYAVLLFTADWCPACKKYEPLYKKLASEAGGQYLFLTTEDTKNNNLAAKYNVTTLPTLMVINSDGVKYIVANRDKLMDEIAQFNIPFEERLAILRGKFEDFDPKTRLAAISGYCNLIDKYELNPEEAAKGAKGLRELFRDIDMDVRTFAAYTYKSLIQKLNSTVAADEAKALRELLDCNSLEARRYAAFAYELLTGKLTPQVAAEEKKALRKEFSDLYADMGEIDCWTLSAKAGVLIMGAEADIGICRTNDGWFYPSAVIGITMGAVLLALGAGKETTQMLGTNISDIWDESYFRMVSHEAGIIGYANNSYRGISDLDHVRNSIYTEMPFQTAIVRATRKLECKTSGSCQVEDIRNVTDNRYEIGLFGVAPTGRADSLESNPPAIIKFDAAAFVWNGAAVLASDVAGWYWSDLWGL